MRAPLIRRARSAAVAVLVVAGLALAPQPAGAAAVAINLCALPGTLAPLPVTAPGTTIPIWGFGKPTTPGNCATAQASLPGPLLEANVGDTVTVTVTNALPLGHSVSFEVPGIAFNPGPVEVAPGSTLTRTFTASKPGTYLYQSGGDSGRQEAMGMYGMLVVRPAANQAYGPATVYDVEAPMVLSAVDPAFNAAPASFDLHSYRATWWLINGRVYPDTQRIVATPGQRILLRYANGGFDHTAMQLLGVHERVIARDATPLVTTLLASTENLPAGVTEDALVTVPATAAPTSRGFPLYNRQLHVTNGPQTGTSPMPLSGGGMLTFIGP